MVVKTRLPLVELPTSQDKVIRPWKRRVEAARTERKQHETSWDILLKDYQPSVKRSGEAEDVKTNAHFRNVEAKKASVFFQLPELILTPYFRLRDPVMDPRTGQPFQNPDGTPVTGDDAVPIMQAVLRQLLGPDEANLEHTTDEVLFDTLCPAGRGAVFIGYRAYVEDVKDPETGQTVPNLLEEQYYIDRISPKRLLTPGGFDSTNFDRAPWIGMEFQIPAIEARRLYQLPADLELGTASASEAIKFKHGRLDEDEPAKDHVRGVALWYRASLYDANVANPEIIRELVLLDAADPTAIVHRRCPWQRVDPRGRVTPESFLGFPIEVLSLRDLSDSSYVPSDCAVTQSQVKEMDTYRRQEVRRRDSNIAKFLYDPEKLPIESKTKLEKNQEFLHIPTIPGALQGGRESIIVEMAKGSVDRSTTESMLLLEQDMEKSLAIPPAPGTPRIDPAERTATGASIRQSNAQARMAKEQKRLGAWLARVIRKFATLVQQFADDDDYVEIVGREGVKRLATWNRHIIAGRYAYAVNLDSQVYTDATSRREQILRLHNFVGALPIVNQAEWIRQLFTNFGFDPGVLMQPAPPPPPPDKPSVSFRFSGEDLLNPIVQAIVLKAGLLEAADLPQPAQETVPEAPRLSRRTEDVTGAIEGTEEPRVM